MKPINIATFQSLTPMKTLLAKTLFSLTITAVCVSLHARQASPVPNDQMNIAIVLQDQISLKAAPRDAGQVHAQLSAGDMIEVRGERLDYLQVYDHRRERAGFVKTSQVKRVKLSTDEAPELLHAIRFVRDTPGSESLGLGLAAAYLKSATYRDLNSADGIEALDALGSMADRLAARASSTTPMSKAGEIATTAHLDLAKAYGLKFKGFEREGRMQICYDGEAFRQVLAMASSQEQKARAVMALTRHECIDPMLQTAARYRFEKWRAQVLDQVLTHQLPDYLKNRVHARRASVWSAIAYQQARIEQAGAVVILGVAFKAHEIEKSTALALEELSKVNRAELADDDAAAYNDASMRVSASRWISNPNARPPMEAAKVAALARQGLLMDLEEGQAGETCVAIKQLGKGATLFRKCSYGLVWLTSATINAQGNVITLAVQPTETWREMWLLKKTAEGWVVDALPPSVQGPELGYVEFAGFTPDGKQVLLAREARVQNKHKRSFEVVSVDTLATDKQASDPSLLAAFQRWQNAGWKANTLSIR
jgi:hypothetical protein